MSSIMKKRKGFTLVELIIVVVILGISLVGVGAFLKNSADISQKQNDEFYFQGDMRDSMQIIDYTIKQSSAVFTVPERMFNDPLKRDEDWSYIGVPVDGANKGKVCIFNYDKKNSVWVEDPITKDSADVFYSIRFDKPVDSGDKQKLLSYKLTGLPTEDGVTPKGDTKVLDTDTEVLSASIVGNKSHDTEESVALAFRNGKKDNPKRASLTLVVDASGSMTKTMSVGKTRMQILKEALHTLIDGLNTTSSGEIDLSVSVIDYGAFANIVGEEESNLGFYNLSEEKEKIDEIINDLKANRNVKFPAYVSTPSGFTLTEVKRSAWTNTADGLRVAYHVIDDYVNLNGKHSDDPNYLILFMDGEPFSLSYQMDPLTSSIDYYYGDKIFSNYVNLKESGSAYSISNRTIFWDPTAYSTFGLAAPQDATIATINHFNSKFSNLTSFLVAVGASTDARRASCSEINQAMNGDTNYYEAKEDTDLQEAINDIKDKISFDFWHVNGPREK